MTIIDSCIIIDFVNDIENEETNILSRLLRNKRPIGINSIIELEVLQGFSEEKEYQRIKSILSCFECLPVNHNTIHKAIDIYRECRKKGHTILMPDNIIASSCIENNVPIFSRDKGFDIIANITGLLKLYKGD
jgi:predicted nucleic acid-binding protein